MYRDIMIVIKQVLKERGWTQAQLAARVGLSESGLKKVLGSNDASFERVCALCSALDLELVDVLAVAGRSASPWRFTEEQEQWFTTHPESWWFLCDLSAAHWQLEPVLHTHQLSTETAEGWLAALERRGVLRRTESGRIIPDDAARTPWQGGPGFGEAVIAPAQDALLAHARTRLRAREDHDLPDATECGFARLQLTSDGARELKAALRAVVQDFARRSRQDAVVIGGRDRLPVGVMTVATPFRLNAPLLRREQ